MEKYMFHCFCFIIWTYFVENDCVPTNPFSIKQKNPDIFEDPNYFNRTLRMPNVHSAKEDSLFCTGITLGDAEAYILKYEPHASKNVVHHLMVYGCGTPSRDTPYWECGEMNDHSDSSVCLDGARNIIYAWALDGDSIEFPPGVGFRVGGKTMNKHIVMQLHYKNKFKEGETDNSGVTLHMTTTKKPKQAGYFVLGNMGYLPPLTHDFHLESACNYPNNYTIYPLGYRTHGHNLGKVTSGYRVRDDVWTEIGRMSPQLPQTFYDVTNPGIAIRKGDILAARCTFDSDRDRPTPMGATNKDEMCNFYILYYTYHPDILKIQYCFRYGDEFKWTNYLDNIPASASSTEGLPPFKMNDPYLNQKPTKRLTSNHIM